MRLKFGPARVSGSSARPRGSKAPPAMLICIKKQSRKVFDRCGGLSKLAQIRNCNLDQPGVQQIYMLVRNRKRTCVITSAHLGTACPGPLQSRLVRHRCCDSSQQRPSESPGSSSSTAVATVMIQQFMRQVSYRVCGSRWQQQLHVCLHSAARHLACSVLERRNMKSEW
jgi:hypothetical protein